MSLSWESVKNNRRKRIAEPVCELARNDRVFDLTALRGAPGRRPDIHQNERR